MVDPVTLGLLVKGGMALGKTVTGAVQKKKAQGMGAPLVDQNQMAMLNATKRMLRARETGTSSFLDKRMNAANNKMMFRRSTMAGGRSLAPYLAMIKGADANIRQQASTERMGLLGSIVTQTQNIADRKMDLLEQDKAQKNLDSAANKQTGEKNLAALAPRAGDALNETDKKKKKTGEGVDGNNSMLKFLSGFSDALTAGTTAEPQ